jgi:hypothetical protein
MQVPAKAMQTFLIGNNAQEFTSYGHGHGEGKDGEGKDGEGKDGAGCVGDISPA